MDNFAGLVVEQDILAVAITEPKDVAENRDCCCAAGICEPRGEPQVRPLKVVHEEEVQDWREIFYGEPICSYALCPRAVLGGRYDFPGFASVPGLGKVLDVRWEEVIGEWDGVGHELDDPACGGERDYHVGPDFEVALASHAAFS